MTMMVYVECSKCNCYVWQNECAQIITNHPETDYFICFECHPNTV